MPLTLNDKPFTSAEAAAEFNSNLDEEWARRAIVTASTLESLMEKLVGLFGWTDTSPLHALLHVENAVRNLRSDLAVEEKAAAECEKNWLKLRDENDALKAKVAAWEEKVKNWLASPEAAQRLAGYQELGAKCADLEKELDAARAHVVDARVVIEWALSNARWLTGGDERRLRKFLEDTEP